MSVDIRHAFVNALPDDPEAEAVGETLPSHWNAEHVIVGDLGPALSDATPLVEAGAGAPGASSDASRGDHVHPSAPGDDAVDSVNGQTGVVVLDAGDVGADIAGAAAAAQAASDPLGAAAAVTTTSIGAVPTARTISAGTGLSGGGDLTANRALAADFGSGAGKVTQGNDARLSDARAPTGAAGGDLSGTYPNPGVVDDSHNHTAATAPGTGAGAVDSVNGETGVVVLDAADVGADAAGVAATAVSAHAAAGDPHPGYLTSAEGNAAYDVAGAAAAAAAASVPTGRTITAGTGLTGGGDLTANRSLAADFGTGAGKVTQGNDARLADARAPTGSAGGDLSGTYPNPSVVDDSHSHTGATLPASASALTALDEGTPLDTAVTSLDFTGAGVTASVVGHAVTVDVPGGSTPTLAEVLAAGNDTGGTPIVNAAANAFSSGVSRLVTSTGTDPAEATTDAQSEDGPADANATATVTGSANANASIGAVVGVDGNASALASAQVVGNGNAEAGIAASVGGNGTASGAAIIAVGGNGNVIANAVLSVGGNGNIEGGITAEVTGDGDASIGRGALVGGTGSAYAATDATATDGSAYVGGTATAGGAGTANAVMAATAAGGSASIGPVATPIGAFLKATGLPTADPAEPDALWADGGRVVQSGSTATSPLSEVLAAGNDVGLTPQIVSPDDGTSIGAKLTLTAAVDPLGGEADLEGGASSSGGFAAKLALAGGGATTGGQAQVNAGASAAGFGGAQMGLAPGTDIAGGEASMSGGLGVSGDTGGRLTLAGGDDASPDTFLQGRNGAAGRPGSIAYLQGGTGDGGSKFGGFFDAMPGTASAHGKVQIGSDNSQGALGEVLTGDGDGLGNNVVWQSLAALIASTDFSGLPTADPHDAGKAYTLSGVLMVSAG